MAKAMVIVESPAKARTINKFLGPQYFVESSMGHIRDLPQKAMGVDLDNDFEPHYEVLPAKKKRVADLKKARKDADTFYLATDRDREGEAIAWHLATELKLPPENTHRVTFNEITKKAIQGAFQHPSQLNMDMVDAQQARRVLDRIVGYQLSPLLWRKITKGLSAGRVQSVTVRLIVEREREIEAFVPEEYWKLVAHLQPLETRDQGEAERFRAELTKVEGKTAKVQNEEQASSLVEELQGVDYAVAKVAKRNQVSKPPPPLTTSLLQQQASSKLRFSAKKTMALAQELYEGLEVGEEGSVGLITYMRTDSFRVADEALDECRKLIPEKYGEQYLPEQPNRFPARKGEQGAHEAIRPTSAYRAPEQVEPFLSRDQHRLYTLIWSRFVASQMKPAIYAVTTVDIDAGRCLFRTQGKELLFDGHTAITGHDLKKDDQILPPLRDGQGLELLKLDPSQHFTKPPPRYTEATLVKTLESKGIGRPSTYAPIITTVQQRGYVTQEKRQFRPTDLGMLVTDKLVKHFPRVLDVEFTSKMEDLLDGIEDGQTEWLAVLRDFYGPFKKALEVAHKDMESAKASAEETGEVCPNCDKPMVFRWSRRGKFLGCSGYPRCRTTMPVEGERTPAPAPKPTDEKCELCGEPMVIRSGRRGEFLACSGFPKCRNTRDLGGASAPDDAPVEDAPTCEKCGRPMKLRQSRRGRFWGCAGYPKCRNTKPLSDDHQEGGKEGAPDAG